MPLPKRHPILFALAAGLAGCAAGPNYHTPPADAPAKFAAAAAAAAAAPSPAGNAPTSAPDITVWWKALGDAELDSLVERAIRSNPDLEIALNRLQQARTYEAVVLGHALPEVDASAAAARGTGTDLSRGRAQQPLVSANNSGGLQHINL